MTYIHKPLADNDIRVLTIEPGGGDHTEPIVCHLEHVPLLPTLEHTSQSRWRGDSYIWPETRQNYDSTIIFKENVQPDSYGAASKTDCETTLEEDQEVLDWRYEWGDYVALSYVWGCPGPEKRITLNGLPFTVTSNLFEALLQLRQSQRIQQGFKVWIDAICINQNDLEERGSQVGRMRDIYASAWHVVMWLGAEADNSDLALTTLRWLALLTRAKPALDTVYRQTKTVDARPLFVKWSSYKSPFRKEIYKALFSLLTRSYWTRMWILQEVASARCDAPVICGKRCLEWRDMHDSAQYIARDEARFGRDIMDSVRPRILTTWSFEFTRSRVLSERQWASERMWDLLIEMTKLQAKQKREIDRSPAIDVSRPLLLGREAAVTDEKDRVYGILGIRGIAEKITVKPDYALSLREIYIDFSAKLLTEKDINIIRMVGRSSGSIYAGWIFDDVPDALNHSCITPLVGPLLKSLKRSRNETIVGIDCPHNLPSWVVCWSCKPAPTAQLLGEYKAGGSSASSDTTFCLKTLSLTTKGRIIDAVRSLSSFHHSEVDVRYPMNPTGLNTNLYGDLQAIRTALWRTIVGDTTSKGGASAPEEYSWLLDPRLWNQGVAGVYTNGFGLHSFMGGNMHLKLCGYTLGQLIFGGDKLNWWQRRIGIDQLYNPTKEQCEALSWAMNSLAWRRLIGTEQGRMGLVSGAVETRDAIAIIRGCDTPMILRERGDGWKVIGEAYIHGVMQGKMAMEDNDNEFTDVKIY
ncbi:hypothetical protein QQS21_012429 [Conoideocrella luteorostrata]|uniref:Heterokaryon incompatibility domain-containing protein n=1 Tax=Conoideocrella luteorostrata TaxID=1105319 RepID=A0AAJ0FSG3_9HYPO|nr:hypothetical protein QQS21_012429 [Conoideocrella luteorostrata]